LIIKEIVVPGYEKVVHGQDSKSGLNAIIAIHNTSLGPALGGTRMWPYQSKEEALTDVLRLAKGMTFKAAAAGLNLGGGKAVIIGNSKLDKNPGLLAAYGKLVQSLQGRYITAEDVGMTQADMDVISQETKSVVGVTGGSGDPSPATAYGVYLGIKAAAEAAYGSDNLTGKTVAVQGLGSVGYHLCQLLHQNGVKLTVTDLDPAKVKRAELEFNALAASPEKILASDCNILAPCALGAVVNQRTLSQLRCDIIAGSANNVLEKPADGMELHQLGILYIPDFVINAGGLINVSEELNGYNAEKAHARIQQIPKSISKIISISQAQKIPTSEAAELMALELLAAATCQGGFRNGS